MLAEVRNKRGYVLQPKGKPLYEDESRFGTKMMKKMGWTEGKGLGASEEGSKDFMRVRYKNNVQGLGYEGRDDQWTQHEECFSDLLKTLNSVDVENCNLKQESENEPETKKNKGKTEQLKEKISGISLEEKSKQSRVRVHYKKFTRGKDLSQYSEKDLANIFGKKVGDKLQVTNEPKGETCSLEEEKFPSTGISIADYFKSKMEAKRNQKNEIGNKENTVNEKQDEDVLTKPNKKKRKKMDMVEIMEINMDEEIKDQEWKSKKDKCHELKCETSSEVDYNMVKSGKGSNKEINIKRKKSETNVDNQEEIIQESAKRVTFKTKRRKSETLEEEIINSTSKLEVAETEIAYEPIKKSKKEKNGIHQVLEKNKKSVGIIHSTSELEETAQTDIALEPIKKKEKKCKKEKYGVDRVLENNKKNVAINSTSKLEEADKSDIALEPIEKKERKSKKEKYRIDQVLENNENNIASPEDQTVPTYESKSKNKKEKYNNQNKKAVTAEKHQKLKRKDVSLYTKCIPVFDAKTQVLQFDEIKKKLNSFNVYRISSFCAEKFRNVSLHDFTGSTLPQIEGYGLSSDLELDVHVIKNDEERITNLWKCVLNKYDKLERPKKTYGQYVKEVFEARKMKKRKPKLYVKTWKRKNAFQII